MPPRDLPLFPDLEAPRARPSDAVPPAPPDPEDTRLADALGLAVARPRLFLGTSSWSFPGWRGLVFGAEATVSRLSRHGLGAYAAHPLLGAVGVDRSYYAPVPVGDYAAYRDQVLAHRADARFLVKVQRDFTQPWGRAPRSKNPAFLDGALALSGSLGPAHEALGKRAIHLVQFSPMGRGAGTPEAFAQRLDAFLGPLAGLRVAVELRDPALLSPAYVQVLARHGAMHCVNVLPEMPGPGAQLDVLEAHGAPLGTLLVRWLRSHALAHDEAESLYDPYDRVQAPADALVDEVARVLARVPDAERVVLVDNKAEGCAPLTLRRVAARLVA